MKQNHIESKSAKFVSKFSIKINVCISQSENFASVGAGGDHDPASIGTTSFVHFTSRSKDAMPQTAMHEIAGRTIPFPLLNRYHLFGYSRQLVG